jgi:probable rRNA maturation factor
LPERLKVSVVDERGRSIQPGLGRWLARVAPARARGLVYVAIVPDARVRALNVRYRRKDRATDVLSFPAGTSTQRPRSTQRSTQGAVRFEPSVGFVVNALVGEIVIARGVARRQAREHGHSEQTELRVLALHGLLHLIGYDHEHDNGEMARLERRLRRKGGLREGLIERAGPEHRRRT